MRAVTSNRPFLKVLLLVSLITIVFWVASFFPELVLILIVSAIASFILKPIVKFLEFRFGMRRNLSIALIFLLIGGGSVFVAVRTVSVLRDTVDTMYSRFRTFPFEEKLNEAAVGFAASIPFINASDVSKKVLGVIDQGLQSLGESSKEALSLAVTLLVSVPFFTFFFLAQGDKAMKKLIERVPNKYFEMTLNVLHRIGRDLVGYMRGWILDSIIIGILSIIGYSIVGIEYAVLIGAVAGIANLVPYLGPIVGAVPAIFVSLIQTEGSFQLVPWILVVTVVIQLLDNVLVQPLCFSKTVDMHPLTVIVVLIIGNTLMGIAGMLVAIPIATILKASAFETYWGLKNYRITA